MSGWSSGARRTRGIEAARELGRRGPAEGPERPQLWLADPPRVEPMEMAEIAPAEREDRSVSATREADRAAAEIARGIEERIGAAAAEAFHDLRRRVGAASAEAERRREERERLHKQVEGEVPGFGAIWLELARRVVHLFRAIATAPLRIGLAFLRPRQA